MNKYIKKLNRSRHRLVQNMRNSWSTNSKTTNDRLTITFYTENHFTLDRR